MIFQAITFEWAWAGGISLKRWAVCAITWIGAVEGLRLPCPFNRMHRLNYPAAPRLAAQHHGLGMALVAQVAHARKEHAVGDAGGGKKDFTA